MKRRVYTSIARECKMPEASAEKIMKSSFSFLSNDFFSVLFISNKTVGFKQKRTIPCKSSSKYSYAWEISELKVVSFGS